MLVDLNNQIIDGIILPRLASEYATISPIYQKFVIVDIIIVITFFIFPFFRGMTLLLLMSFLFNLRTQHVPSISGFS